MIGILIVDDNVRLREAVRTELEAEEHVCIVGGQAMEDSIRRCADTGFTGYVAQEFIPTRDPMTSLAEAYQICNV